MGVMFFFNTVDADSGQEASSTSTTTADTTASQRTTPVMRNNQEHGTTRLAFLSPATTTGAPSGASGDFASSPGQRASIDVTALAGGRTANAAAASNIAQRKSALIGSTTAGQRTIASPTTTASGGAAGESFRCAHSREGEFD